MDAPRDDQISRDLRTKHKLPDNWRAYSWEAKPNGRIKVTGAIAHYHGEIGRAWLRPLAHRRSFTVKGDDYRGVSFFSMPSEEPTP